MKVIYSDQKLPDKIDKYSIFLAGPTPRSKDVKSWRPLALEILEKEKWWGEVYVPERQDRTYKCSYEDQVEWEKKALDNSSVIVFWIPCNMKNMPALTTRTEFGRYVGRGRDSIFYGRPSDAEKCRYLDWMYGDLCQSTPHNNLEELLKDAIWQGDYSEPCGWI